ncbi:MAG TPA: PfkB family carbohydrate kinase [Gaiellaceae bacterium]|nr:PfkB family carbohydrate kinase [Gaiellaceae bacterium]
MYDFVAVGDVMLDVHVPAAEGRVHADARVVVGGSAMNAALAAAELGARACVVGCVGDDVAGRAVREKLGIDARFELGERTGTAVYVGDSVVADRGANAGFVPRDVPAAHVTLVSGYLDTEGIHAAVALASGLVAVDLQGRAHDLPHVDVLFGEGDADVVVLTRGAGEAEARRGDEVARVRPPSVPEPPPGAGDRFAAAFLLALTAGRALQDCLEHAIAFASRSPHRPDTCLAPEWH